MASLENEKRLTQLILESWNADPLISTKMFEGDDLHKRHTLNMLWSMLPNEVAEDWIDYYNRKLSDTLA